MPEDNNIRPVYQQSKIPWLFMLLMLPLFFLFGWVTNEAIENNQGNGLELGVGGSANETREQQEIVTPTPNTMMDEEESTPTDEPTPSPSITPTEDGENVLDI